MSSLWPDLQMQDWNTWDIAILSIRCNFIIRTCYFLFRPIIFAGLKPFYRQFFSICLRNRINLVQTKVKCSYALSSHLPTSLPHTAHCHHAAMHYWLYCIHLNGRYGRKNTTYTKSAICVWSILWILRFLSLFYLAHIHSCSSEQSHWFLLLSNAVHNGDQPTHGETAGPPGDWDGGRG